MKPNRSGEREAAGPLGMSMDYVFLLLAAILLLLGLVAFAVLPPELPIRAYRTPVLAFLAGLAVTAVGNIIVGFIQKGVSREAVRALSRPIENLEASVDRLRQLQLFYEAGVVGAFPNRSSAMRRFRSELEREDRTVDFVGTSLLGLLDPAEENEDKRALHRLLLQKRRNNVRIRALLMHPAYGEFRERVENRERAAVARDIQNTLRYLVATPQLSEPPAISGSVQPAVVAQEKLLQATDVRLYPGVVTAQAIFTSRAMLVNVSTLHGPVYDNFTMIIEDTPDPNSIFKKFKANHFEEPWRSEKTARLDTHDGNLLTRLLQIDFARDENRFAEGNWPPTIPKDRSPSEAPNNSMQPTGGDATAIGDGGFSAAARG